MTGEAKRPLGLKVVIGFHLVNLVIWFVGQTLAVVAYDTVSGWGLQGPRDLLDPVIVEVNRAIGLTDTLVMLPLFVVAIVGLWRERFYGAVASWLVFGMTLYWPVVFWTSQRFFTAAGIRHAPVALSVVVVPAACMLMACWGSWYLYRINGRLH